MFEKKIKIDDTIKIQKKSKWRTKLIHRLKIESIIFESYYLFLFLEDLVSDLRYRFDEKSVSVFNLV